MKRRDILKLMPLSLAGLAAKPDFARALGEPIIADMSDGAPPLSKQYTDEVVRILTWIRENQSENILEASYAIADTVMRGNTVWMSWDMGHSTQNDILPGRDGVPELFSLGYNAGRTKKGDMFLCSAGSVNAEDTAEKDILVVGMPMAWGSDAKMSDLIERDTALHRNRPYSDIWIESNITTLGAIMHIPGMPAPTGPISGVVGQTVMWMMFADACRIIAREGKSVPVRGDEAKLGTNVVRASLVNPLMDDYFETLMRQFEMIFAELGNIRKIASMAVDALMAGGKVYGYSKEQVGLAVEAQTRRGGLTLFRGAWVKDGTVVDYGGTPLKPGPNDFVLMGLVKPDDPVDLKSLEFFKRAGAKVGSIGPMLRNNAIPDGPTVPKSTDAHAGRMCDTYGLFALPGFDRKICPTSGPMLLQLFWSTCMEIAKELYDRTDGNVPGVFYSAAIKDGTYHMHLMSEWWKERGY